MHTAKMMRDITCDVCSKHLALWTKGAQGYVRYPIDKQSRERNGELVFVSSVNQTVEDAIQPDFLRSLLRVLEAQESSRREVYSVLHSRA